MSFRKFGKKDFFTNTLRAYPKVNFYIYNSKVYYNSIPDQDGTRNVIGGMTVPEFNTVVFNSSSFFKVKNIDSGHISLYEYNVDRPLVYTDRIVGSWPQEADGGTYPTGAHSYTVRKRAYEDATKPIDFVEDRGIIYPFITKDGARASWKTVTNLDYTTAFHHGDVLTANYPLSASISREYITIPFESTSSYNRHYVSLRNRLDYYGTRSPHYFVTSSFGNKDEQTLNLISIPSIFYGTKINPGSVSLKFYITGTLAGELTDFRKNGELIQSGPAGSNGSGSVAGVVLYDEGFVLLTGSWNISSGTYGFVSSSSPTADNPKWIYFAAGAYDNVNTTNTANTPGALDEASFNIDFKGHTETQVMTMFAHAGRGEVNYSNNPTFIEKGQDREEYRSSYVYEQKSDITMKNTVSSSYLDYDAPFKRQVYISRVGVYDQYKNLIGLATLSNPIKKQDDDDISFKLKMDI